jgi:hypothetical protein
MAARGGVRFTLSTDDRPLRRGLGHAKGQVDHFAKGIGHVSALGGSGLAGVAGGLMSIGGAAEFVRESASATMDLYKATLQVSRVTGYDTETASAWVQVAKERGIGTEQLTKSYTGLAKQIRSAQGGSQKAISTFSQLGVSQRDLARGDTATIIGKIADSFQRHADGGGKAAIASQLFGRSYTGMLGILNRGRTGVRELVDEQVKHGGVLKGNVRDLQKARDQQLRFNAALEKLKITVGRAVLPEIGKLADKMSRWLGSDGNQKKVTELVKAFLEMGKQLLKIAGYLTPLVRGVANFAAKHKDLAKIVGQLIAIRIFIGAISFLNPTRGLIAFAGRVRGLGSAGRAGGKAIATGLGSAWPKASAALGKWAGPMTKTFRAMGALAAVSFVATYGPSIARDVQNIYNAVAGNKTSQPWWKSALKIGAGIAGGVGGFFVGGIPGAVIGAGTAYSLAGSAIDAFSGRSGDSGKTRAGSSLGLGEAGMEADPGGALPNFDAPASPDSAGRSSGGGSSKPKDKRPGQILAEGNKLMQRFTDAKAKADDADTRLWARGVDPNSAKGMRERQRMLETAHGLWKPTRSALRTLARKAAAAGLGSTANRLISLIHSGDQADLELRAQINEAKAGSKTDSSDPSALLDQTNRRLATAQATAQADDAFIRAAFTAGDIGAGGRDAYSAAGGLGAGARVGGGSIVNVTINTLHPGDARTKSDIARVVTTAVGGQGNQRRPRQKVGGRR